MGGYSEIINACKDADSLESLRNCMDLNGLGCIDECKKALGKAWSNAKNIEWPDIRERILGIIEKRLNNIEEFEKELDNFAVSISYDFEVEKSNPPAGIIELIISNDNKILSCDVKGSVKGGKNLNIRGGSFIESVAANSSKSVKIHVEAPSPGSYSLAMEWEAAYGGNKVLTRKSENIIELDFPKQSEEPKKDEPGPRESSAADRETTQEPRSPVPQPRQAVQETIGQAPQQSQPQTIDAGDLIAEAFKHAAAGIAGFAVGGFMPEVRKFEKPVYVDDVPYITQNGVTIILEDQSNVVIEDEGDVVIIRRPKLVELINQVSLKTAKSLIDDFKQRALNVLPSLGLAEGGIDWRAEDLVENHVEGLIDKEKNRGREVREEELMSVLPRVFKLEVRYGLSGTIRKRAKLRLVAGAHARIERLYLYGNDHEPLSINETLEGLGIDVDELRSGAENAVLVLASPSGWARNSIEQARRGAGSIKLVLIDLKTGEANYDLQDPLLRAIIDGLGYGEAPVMYNDYIKHLDKMLMAGEIDEATHRRKIIEVMKNPA